MLARSAIRLAAWLLVAALLLGSSCGNSPPMAPTLSGVTATETKVTGTVSACTDDGAPNGTCDTMVAVVASGTTGPPQGSGAVDLGSAGGSFAISGLAPATTYDVLATASDSALTSSSTAPVTTASAIPVVGVTSAFGGVGAANASINGSISSCADCTSRDIRIYDQGVTCMADCSCTGGPVGVGLVTGSTWQATGLQRDTTYAVVGENTLPGSVLQCSTGLDHHIPNTIAGCSKVDLAHVHEIPANIDVSNGVRGARATWLPLTNALAPDFANAGFTLQGIWVGIDHGPVSGKWIETGVTQGFEGQNVRSYYWAWGNNATGDFEAELQTGTVPTNQGVTFKVVSCDIFNPGCPPWSASTSPRQWVACHGEQTSTCSVLTWPTALDPRTLQYFEGGESTCLENARLDRTVAHDSQYRHQGSVWANTVNLGASQSYIGAFPPPDASHDIACCTGSTTSGGFVHCTDPNRSRYWVHSGTPTGTCN